jgi:hypothetical protein
MSALTDWSDGEITDLINERDEARHMVAEMRAALIIGRDIVIETSSNNRHNKFVEDTYDVIEASAHVAGRWCLASERDEALARAEKAEAREREIGEELDKATGMVEMHVDDAEAARLLWRQSEAACAQMHAQCDAAIRERDELGRRSAADFQGLEEIRSETSRQLNAALDERDAAIKERDEALAILRDMTRDRDVNGVVDVNTFVDRARKLLGDI